MKQYKKYPIIQVDDEAVMVDKEADILKNNWICDRGKFIDKIAPLHKKDDEFVIAAGAEECFKIIAHTGMEKLKDSSLSLFEMPDNPMVLAREAAIMNNYDIKDDVFKHGFVLGYMAAGGHTEEEMHKAMYKAAKIGQRRKPIGRVPKVCGRKVFDSPIYVDEEDEIIKSLKKYPTSALVEIDVNPHFDHHAFEGNKPKVDKNNHLIIKEFIYE